MQRINLFPSPGFLNGIWGSANHTVDNGEMKVLADGGNYSAVTLPATGRDELVLNIEVKDSGNVQAFDSDWKFLANTGEFRNVADWTVKNLRFTPTAGKGLIIGFFPLDGWLTVRRPQLELASTFDTGVGGGAWASGLLHGGYDAARIGASVGRVMSDDGDELAQASERGHRIGCVERCDRHRERGRDENLLHRQRRIAIPLSKHERDQDHNVLVRRCRPIPGGACGSVGTRHFRAAQWGEGRYLGIQHDPRLGGGKYDVSGFHSGKGLSDPDRVGDLHARRLGGIAVNGSDVVRRGHDASSLALMGVMA